MTQTLEYDATGLLCPLPVLRANRKLRELAPGGLLTVRATDPAAEADFPAFCRQTGHELVSSTREGEVLAKHLYRRTPKQIELHSLNPEHPNRTFQTNEVEWIARIIWASQ